MISGRGLLLTLIALNLLALLWWTGQLVPLFGSPLEPQRLTRQIQPDMLRVVTPAPRAQASGARVVAGLRETAASGSLDGERARPVPLQGDAVGIAAGSAEAAGAPSPAFGAGAASAIDPAASSPAVAGSADIPAIVRPRVAPTLPAVEPPARAGDTPAGMAGAGTVTDAVAMLSAHACLIVDDLAYADYQTQAKRLRDDGLVVAAEQTDAGRHFVYAGPFDTPEVAETKAQELTALGVRDTYIMRFGQLKNAVSVGLLPTRELAVQHRDSLMRRGARNLEVGPLNASGSRYRLLATGAPDALARWQRELGAGARLEPGSCP